MKNELRDFGLSDNEIDIYLVLVKKGTRGPTEIAKQTGLARSYVYDVLRRLQEKGMVSTIGKNQKRQYIAISSKHLLEVGKQRLSALGKVVEDLENLKLKHKEDMQVELQTGKYVFRSLLNDILLNLKKGDETVFFGIDDDYLMAQDPQVKYLLDLYLAKIVKSGISERLIVKQGTREIPHAKTTTYRFLPKKMIGNLSFIAYADRLAIFVWGKPDYMIFITNHKVSQSYKNQFEIMWDKAKP
jgi:sugar-specific transcriptional regulator TrmB